MKRSLLLLAVLLAACSSNPTTKVSTTAPVDKALEDKSPLLSVVGAAPLGNDYTYAVQAAKADAHANVVKFLAAHARSSSETTNRTDDSVTVHSGFTKTNVTAASMVRGLVFDEEVQEGDRVLVRGVITEESINRARRLQSLMK